MILSIAGSLAIMAQPLRFCIAPLLFIQACLAGYQFASVLKDHQGPFAQLYGADLIGGAMGALVFGVLLFPLFGAAGAVLTLVGVKILSLYHSVALTARTAHLV